MTSTTTLNSAVGLSAWHTGQEVRVAANVLADQEDAFWEEFNAEFNSAERADYDREDVAREAAADIAECVCFGDCGPGPIEPAQLTVDAVRFGAGFEPPF